MAAFEIDGTYGLEEVRVKLPGGAVFAKTVDVLAVREDLAAVTWEAGKTSDAEVNAKYREVLARHGLPDPGTACGCIFVARHLMARREAILKKFDGIVEAVIADSPESPSSIPASTQPA